MMGQEHLDVGAYALNALPADEATAVAEHLGHCATCAAEYSEFLETAAQLAAAVATPPPAELRAAVLSAASRTRQLPPLMATPATLTSETSKTGPDIDTRSRRAAWWRRPATLVAAAAAAIALIVGGVLVGVHQRGVSPEQAAEQCVKAAPDARRQVPTVGTGGSVTVAPTCDAAIVQLPTMPELPRDRGYQLWVITGKQTRSAGMVSLAAQSVGNSSIVVTDLQPSDTEIGVTVEPEGGSPSPTTKPIWVVPFSS